MANCISCSAPLAAHTQICSYCGVRNDIDLKGRHDYQIVNRQSPRVCPACVQSLQTIVLNLETPLEIERCASCFGLFFDPGEVESLLDSAVSPVFDINLPLLGSINQERYAKDKPVKYLKCPVCQTLMNRVVFGHRSGVVIDRCISHGVWLDGGEISHLLEWKKAGGQLLHDKKAAEQPRKKSVDRSAARNEVNGVLQDYGRWDSDSELLESVASVIFKVFQ